MKYKIKTTFENGKMGTIDFLAFIHKGGGFDKFKDRNYFKNFQVNSEVGTIIWGDGEVDVATETLYSLATGIPHPEWMQPKEMAKTSWNLLESILTKD